MSPDIPLTRPSQARARAQGNGRFVASPETAARDAEAARLRVRGLSLREICEQLGYSDTSSASQAVQRALAEVRREPAEELRRMELARLDFLWRACLKVLERHHVVVAANGTIVWDHEMNGPLEDDGPVLQAVDRMIKIQDRRAKLEGLDAPTKHEVRNVDDYDLAIRGLMDELAARSQARADAETVR